MEYKEYRKKGTQPMTPWVEGMDLENVSISEADIQNGSPKQGDMIAVSKSDPNDKWLVAKDFFEKNYEEA